MSNQLNQENKEAVWDFWQKLNHVGAANVPAAVEAAVHSDVNWNVSAPIDQLVGADNAIAGFWAPLFHSFPDLKHEPYVFMGGIDEGSALYATEGGEEWVSGCGYLTGAFANDWLGIPATGRKTNIWFGVFYVMREGKIAEAYLQLDILAVMRAAGFQVLPPAPGAEGGVIPGPLAKDGLLLTEQDPLSSRKSQQLVQAMGRGMRRYLRSRDGGDLRSMEQDKYWHPDMKWYGPSGIGACFSKDRIRRFSSAALAGRLRRSQHFARWQRAADGAHRRGTVLRRRHLGYGLLASQRHIRRRPRHGPIDDAARF